MGNDVIFSVFDNMEGPVVLHSSLNSSGDAQKIAVRSFIAIGAMEEDQDLRGKQAVVPIPSLGKIAFYHMFRVRDTTKSEDKATWATIGYISNSSTSINFFHSIPAIQKNIIPIIDFVQQHFVYDGKNTALSTPIISNLNSLRSPIVAETFDIAPSIVATERTADTVTADEFQKGDLGFIFDYFQEDLDKAFYSLMMEEPVLIIGDIREIIQKVVTSLELLVPHRSLIKKYLTSYIEPKDEILICSSHVNFLKKYKGITTINIINRQITSKSKGLTSISDLISTLKVVPKHTQQSMIKSYLDNLYGNIARLMEMCEREQVDRKEIKDLRSSLKADELNIVVALASKHAPQLKSKIEYFAFYPFI